MSSFTFTLLKFAASIASILWTYKHAYKKGYSKGVEDSRDVEHIQVFTSVQDLANYLTQERH